MSCDEYLSDYYQKIKTLNKKLEEMEKKYYLLKMKDLNKWVDKKYDRFLHCLKVISDCQEKVTTATLINAFNAQEKTENFLHLSYNLHNNFKNVIASKYELDKLNANKHIWAETNNDLAPVIDKLIEMDASIQYTVADQLDKFSKANALLQNIENMKIIDKKNKNNSDLGCYPIEENQFVTSSPICQNKLL